MTWKSTRMVWCTALAVVTLATAGYAAPVKPDPVNPASKFQLKRADIGNGYATVNVFQTPDKSSYIITCNCDDRTVQDMTCPTSAYACVCEPSANLSCQ